MLQNLLSAIKNSNAFVASESNRISQFSFSSGEHLEVSIVIYQIKIDECDEEDIIPKDYDLAFRRSFSDSRSDLGNDDFFYTNFKFASPLFTKSVKSLGRRALNSDCSISNGFQLYQELWCMDYLPKVLKEQGIEAKKLIFHEKEKVHILLSIFLLSGSFNSKIPVAMLLGFFCSPF